MEENYPNGRRISPSVKRVARAEVDKAHVERQIFSGCYTALITPLRGRKVDEETKPIVHAILESVHPESIAIFKFDLSAK